MKNRENNPPRDLFEGALDGAIDALRETPVPPGPPDETLRAVLAAGETSCQTQPKTFTRRIFAMNRIAKIAAAVLAIAIGTGLLIWLPIGSATVAWADVQERIRKIRTLTFQGTMRQEGMDDLKVPVMIMEPGLIRQELVIGGERITQIINMAEGTMLILEEKTKKATRLNLSALPVHVRKASRESNVLTKLKKLIEKSQTELGDREIAGRPAKGYQVKEGKQSVTIWVDARTGDPLEMNMTMYQGTVKLTLFDFEVDKPLDASLFSMAIPKGYKQIGGGTVDIKEATADDLAGFFKFWAESRGGTFPDTLSEMEWIRDCLDRVKAMEKELGDEKSLKWGIPMGRARLFLQMHPKTHKQYAGKGVKLGDADTAVFWYKPKGAETYKVIYGDLTIKDVAGEDLPIDAEKSTETDKGDGTSDDGEARKGMSIEGMTPKDAARATVEAYRKASAAEDWTGAAKLWAIQTPKVAASLAKKYPVATMDIGEPFEEQGFHSGGWLTLVVPVTFTREDGKTEQHEMVVNFLGGAGERRCRMSGMGTFSKRLKATRKK